MTGKIDKIEQNMANRCTMKNTVSMARLTGDTVLPECKSGGWLADGWVDDHTDGESTRQPITKGGTGPRQSLWRHWVTCLFTCALFLPATAHAATSFALGNTVLEPCTPTVVLTANASNNIDQGQIEGDPTWSTVHYSVMSGPQFGYTRPPGFKKTGGTDYTVTPMHNWVNSSINPAQTSIGATYLISGCENIDRGGWVESSEEGVYLKVEGNSSWSVNHIQTPTTLKLLWSFNTSLASNGTSSHSNSGTVFCSNPGGYNCDIMWPSKQVSGLDAGAPAKWFTTNYNSPVATGDFLEARRSDGWPSSAVLFTNFRYITSGSWRVLALYAPKLNTVRATTLNLPSGTFTLSSAPHVTSWYGTTRRIGYDMRQSPALNLTLSPPKPTCTASVPIMVSGGNIWQPDPGGEVKLLGNTNISVTCTNSNQGHVGIVYAPGVIFSGAAGPVTTNPSQLATSTPGLVVVGRNQNQLARSCAFSPDSNDVLFDGKTKYLPSDGSMTWSLSQTPNEVTSKSTAISWYVCAPGTTAPNPGPFSAKAAWSVVLN